MSDRAIAREIAEKWVNETSAVEVATWAIESGVYAGMVEKLPHMDGLKSLNYYELIVAARTEYVLKCSQSENDHSDQ